MSIDLPPPTGLVGVAALLALPIWCPSGFTRGVLRPLPLPLEDWGEGSVAAAVGDAEDVTPPEAEPEAVEEAGGGTASGVAEDGCAWGLMCARRGRVHGIPPAAAAAAPA